MSAKSQPDLTPKELRRENARLRGDLLTIGGRVSHDLLTPLSSILISIELLKETLPGAESPVTTAMESLQTSAEEIRQLIESISALAKATVHPLPTEKVAMMDIVSSVLMQFKKRISRRGAAVGAPESWPEVEAVPKWLDLIWRNFLANALQRGGSKIQLGWLRAKTEFRFWASDNGAAVPAGETARVFQPFDSLHGLGSAGGLGLSIAQRLVELQGGRCFYEVNPGPCFCFTLPAKRAG